MSPAGQQDPYQAEAIMASIEDIMARANTLTAPSFNLTSGLPDNPEESLVCQFCLSRFKSTWRSKISWFASLLRSYLTELEGQKCHGSQELLGPRLGQTRNIIRLKDQIESEYRMLLDSITNWNIFNTDFYY